MLAIVLSGLMLWLSLEMLVQANVFLDLQAAYEVRDRMLEVKVLGAEVDRYFRDTGGFPADFATLTGTAGYEHARLLTSVWAGYAVSGVIDDGTWRFTRTVSYAQPPQRGLQAAQYLDASHNTCGSGDFATGTSWCGARASLWWRREAREDFPAEITAERLRLKRLAHRLVQVYNNTGAFPDDNGAGGHLAAGTAANFTALVGYAGTATNCSGIFVWAGMGLSCEDLYSVWGTKVTYNFVSSTRMTLVTVSTIMLSSGASLRIGLDISL